MSGAVAATGIGLLGSMAVGGATSVGEDIIDGKGINPDKFWLSVGVGVIGGLISGSGANAKTLLSKSNYIKDVLKTAISPKKNSTVYGKTCGYKEVCFGSCCKIFDKYFCKQLDK